MYGVIYSLHSLSIFLGGARPHSQWIISRQGCNGINIATGGCKAKQCQPREAKRVGLQAPTLLQRNRKMPWWHPPPEWIGTFWPYPSQGLSEAQTLVFLHDNRICVPYLYFIKLSTDIQFPWLSGLTIANKQAHGFGVNPFCMKNLACKSSHQITKCTKWSVSDSLDLISKHREKAKTSQVGSDFNSSSDYPK